MYKILKDELQNLTEHIKTIRIINCIISIFHFGAIVLYFFFQLSFLQNNFNIENIGKNHKHSHNHA